MTERRHVCEACGATFAGRRRKFCYDCLCEHSADPKLYKRQYGRLNKRDLVCAECGAEFRAYPQAKHCMGCVKRAALARVRAPTTCQRCGDVFKPRNRGQKFCSQECRYPPRPPVPRRTDCGWCHGPLTGQFRLYCSKKCGAAGRLNFARYGAVDRCHMPICVQCGAVGGWSPASPGGVRYLCELCLVDDHAERRDFSQARRLAAKRAGDRTTWHDLWDEYGGNCAICRRKCKPDEHWTHPRYPTKDHVVPIAQGGEDVRANLRLACRECNIKRRAGGGNEQLRLVG